MSKGSAPILYLNWEGDDLVMSVKGTPASAKATRARRRADKSLLTFRDRENLTAEISALIAQAFADRAVQTGAE
jgi:hypothetical protein